MIAPASQGPAPRLLIVDDESAMVKALCDVLGEQGYAVQGCCSGEQALGALRSAQFDLLLTDLAMPQLDGLALLRAALPLDPDLGAIVMTGEGTIASAVEAMQIGALDYVLKPFRLHVMLPVLSRALAVRQLRLDNRQLERTVHERTGLLEQANRELEAANRELRAANKELEAFSYSVSHDLRAPLRAVDGFSHALLELLGPPAQAPGAEPSAGAAPALPEQLRTEATELVQRVIEGAATMNGLIDGMLRLARYSRRPLALRPLELQPLVASVVRELRASDAASAAHIELGALPAVQGDEVLLRQVFSNLLSNAIKFSAHSSAPLVEVGHRREGNECICFVRDNGVGFDMRYADKLFGVFQRLHTPYEFAGTGVGLSIVQRIVERHGGRVWAESEPGKGATFYFALPSGSSPPPASPLPPASPSPAAPLPAAPPPASPPPS